MTYGVPELAAFYDGWKTYNAGVVEVLRGLTEEQVALRIAPHQWAIWQLASHIAGTRASWFELLREVSPELRDHFRVQSTTVPDMPLEDALWEDDENHPRSSVELVDALTRTWDMVEECLERWTSADLKAVFELRRERTERIPREWVLYHLLEHDLHHGGEISQILGSNGLPVPDL